MSDNDDDSSYGENEVDDMYIIDEISQYEYYHANLDEDGDPMEERRNGNYYIGCYSYAMDSYLETTEGYTVKVFDPSGLSLRFEKTPKMFFGECISANTFFHFKFSDIVYFLDYCNRNHYTNHQYANPEYLLPFEPNVKVHILQLHIEQIPIQEYIAEQYLCVLKTHWISLVQRHWRSVLLARKKYAEYFQNPKNLFSRELGRRGGPKVNGLRGMLSCYSTK